MYVDTHMEGMHELVVAACLIHAQRKANTSHSKLAFIHVPIAVGVHLCEERTVSLFSPKATLLTSSLPRFTKRQEFKALDAAVLTPVEFCKYQRQHELSMAGQLITKL